MTTALARNAALKDILEDLAATYVAANPESQKAARRAAAHMPGGNTRTTIHFEPFALTIARGEEGWLHDVDGHRYADFVNEYSAGLFGHSPPEIRAAVDEALSQGFCLGGPNRYEARLAELISSRFASMEFLRFCNSGTEANLLAVGTARAVTGRSKVLIFADAYHGSLLYFHHGPSPVNAPVPVVTARYNDLEDAGRLIEANKADLAAVIVEPMQGASGCIPGTSAFLAGLRELCTRHGIVLIFDEVMTSRLSPGGAQALAGIRPDMTTLGKYVGGGITLAAFGGRRDMMRRFDPSSPDVLPHGGTFNNNVLAMCAGVRAFETLVTPEALARMNGLGDRLRDRINAIAERERAPLRLTGLGSLVGVHFTYAREILRASDVEHHAGPGGASDLSRLMHFDLLAAGHYAARRGYMAFSLATTEAQVEALGDSLEEFIKVRGDILRATVGRPAGAKG
jgi:glutamate-1-semialdehyde 2,1-aminomutase